MDLKLSLDACPIAREPTITIRIPCHDRESIWQFQAELVVLHVYRPHLPPCHVGSDSSGREVHVEQFGPRPVGEYNQTWEASLPRDFRQMYKKVSSSGRLRNLAGNHGCKRLPGSSHWCLSPPENDIRGCHSPDAYQHSVSALERTKLYVFSDACSKSLPPFTTGQ